MDYPELVQKCNVVLQTTGGGVANKPFDFWLDAHVTGSLFDATSGFRFSAPVLRGVNDEGAMSTAGLDEGVEVAISVRRTDDSLDQQIKGRIDDIIYETSHGGGTHMRVSGRCHMGPLVDSDALPSIAMADSTYRDVILASISRYGFGPADVLIDNDANRLLLTGKAASGAKLSATAPADIAAMKIGQAHPHAGETIYAFLERHAKRFGLLIWGTADGKIVFGRPNYEQSALYNLTCLDDDMGSEGNLTSFNTALSASRHRNAKHVPSEVHVFGKSHGHDWARSDVHAVVEDDYAKKLGFTRVLTVSDRNVRTKEEAIQRGKHELSVRRQHADVLQFQMQSYEQRGAIYAIDTIANVDYPLSGAHGEWYINRREFNWSKQNGSITSLDLVPKGSIALGNTPFADRQD